MTTLVVFNIRRCSDSRGTFVKEYFKGFMDKEKDNLLPGTEKAFTLNLEKHF